MLGSYHLRKNQGKLPVLHREELVLELALGLGQVDLSLPDQVNVLLYLRNKHTIVITLMITYSPDSFIRMTERLVRGARYVNPGAPGIGYKA